MGHFSRDFERAHPLVATVVYLAESLGMIVLVFLAIAGVIWMLTSSAF